MSCYPLSTLYLEKMPVVPELPLSRRVPLASVESSAAAADPKATQLTIDKVLAACLLRDTKPRQSRLGVCSQRPPQLSLAEYQAAWKGVTSWLRATVHAQAVAGGEAKGVAVLGVGVVRHRGYRGAVHIAVPYFELDEQFGRVYGLKGHKPSETNTPQAPDNVIKLTGSELAAVVNHAAEVGGTAHLTEHQAVHALGSLSHGLGLALGVNWLSFKEGWQPVRLWLGFGYLCSDGTGVVSLSLAYYCKDKPPHRPHSARRFKAPSPHHQLEAREDQEACTPTPPSAPKSARARLQSRGVEHKGRRLVLQATIKDPLTPRQASLACSGARVCLPCVSVLETCNPLLPGCTRVAASLLSSPSSRIGVHYCSTRFLRLLADLTLNAGETAVGGEGKGREARGHTPRRRKYMTHALTTNHNTTKAAPEDAKKGSGSAMGGGAFWLHRYTECLRSLQHPTHHTSAAFRRQLTASLPASVVGKQRAEGLPAGVMQRLGACARLVLESATEEGVEAGIATQVLLHFQHRLCVALLDYVLLCPLEAHRLELKQPTYTHSPVSARQREEYGRPLVHKDSREPKGCLDVHERIHQQACFRALVVEVDGRLWVCRGGLQIKQLLQDITTHNTFTLVDLPASLVDALGGPMSLPDLESRVTTCLAQGRQQVSESIISPTMQLLAKMTAQAPSNEAAERLRRLGALLLRRTLRQVLRSSLLRLQSFFTLHDSPASHKPAAILLTAHWDAVSGAIVLEMSVEQLFERLTALLAQVAYAFNDPPPLDHSSDSDTLAPLCLSEPCLPLPPSPSVGGEWGVDEEASQLQALVSQLNHHADTIAHTAYTHAHTTTTTLLGPACSRVVQSTATGPSMGPILQGQEAHQAVEGRAGLQQSLRTSQSISRGSSAKPQPTWKRESSVGLQAVIADLAHLRALTAALHEAQQSLLRHPWGLCSVDACALVQDMQARLDQRLMHHRQGLTQALQARVSEIRHGLKRVTRQSLRQALAHFSSGYEDASSGYAEPPRSHSPTPTTDAPSLPPPSEAIELMDLDELLSLEGYLHKHAGGDKDRFSRACGGVRVLEGVLVSQCWLSLSLGQHVMQAHHSLRTFLAQLKWSGELVQRQRGAWDSHLSAKRKHLIAQATDTQDILHTRLAPRVLCPPLDLPQHMSEIEDTLQSLDSVLEQMQAQRHEATALTHTMQRLGLGVMPIAGLEDGEEGGEGEGWQIGQVLRRVWGALQATYRHHKHYTHHAPLLLHSLHVQQVESAVWAQEQCLKSLLHSLETGPWAVQLRGLRETCTQALRQLGHSRLRPRLPLLTSLTCPHLTPSHWPALYSALHMPLPEDATGGGRALVLHDVLQHFESLGSEEAKAKALAQLNALTRDAQRDAALATQLTHLHTTLDTLTIKTMIVAQEEQDPSSLPSSPPPQCGLQLAPGALSYVESAVCELQSRLSSLLPTLPPSSLCHTDLTTQASALSLRLSACASLLPHLTPLDRLPDYETQATLPLYSRLELEQVLEQREAMLHLLVLEPRVSVLSAQAEVRLRGQRLSQALAALEDETNRWRQAQQAKERKDQDTNEDRGEEQTRPASTVDSAAT